MERINMTQNIINAHKEFLKNIITEALLTGAKFHLMNSNTWEHSLPQQFKDEKAILLDIKGWSLEQTYLTDEGVFVQTAFGDEENSRLFLFDEIINVVSFEDEVLYQKTIAFYDYAFKNGDKSAKKLGYIPLPEATKKMIREYWAANIK